LDFTEILQKVNEGHMDNRAGWCVEMTRYRKIWILLDEGPNVFRKVLIQSIFVVSDVQ